MHKQYCFTLDDNIRFFEDLCTQNAVSIFDCAYLKMLKRCHDLYGCKFQLNMFYAYAPGSFSLTDVPSKYRSEFTQNAHWLKFSFHARHNNPPFPYETNDELLVRDYFDVMRELVRIVGIKSIAATTTLHYVAATKTGCSLLRRFGVQGLIGMFYNRDGREALRYYVSSEHWLKLQQGELYHDPHTDLYFAHNDLVLNQHSVFSAEERIRQLDIQVTQNRHAAFLQLMTHEQYFYSDYVDFQPDFEMKLFLVVEYLHLHSYVSCFLEDFINKPSMNSE